MTDFIVAPPDPVKVNQWAGQIRVIVSFFAGIGVLGGVWAGVSAEQIANWLTAILTLAGVAGAIWTSFKSWRAHADERAVTVASAMASAQQGTPVVVTVTPVGEPNTVTKISEKEQEAAPNVPNVVPQPAPVT